MNIKKTLVVTTAVAMLTIASLSYAYAAEPAAKSQEQTKNHISKHHENKLAEIAKKKGITVEELKAQMPERGFGHKGFGHKGFGKRGLGHKGKANLEELAKKKGITVEELKAQLEQKREAKLAEIARKKGVTVEELKAKLDAKRVKTE